MTPGRIRIDAAVRAEPPIAGTRRHGDPLSHQIKLLGALLGQVITEQEGVDLFRLVERSRRRAIAARAGEAGHRDALEREIEAIDTPRAVVVARAFTLYFQLVNLAEERHRIRLRSARARRAHGNALVDSLAGTAAALYDTADAATIEALVARLRVHPVLTAHPTEARRRTQLLALRRVAGHLERLDDPRLTPDEDRDARRRLREEITLLWRTAEHRSVTPTPLDEVRAAMTFFDATLFRLVPGVYRALDEGLSIGRLASRAGSAGASDLGRAEGHHGGPPGPGAPARVPAFLSWGSWIGSDRDGNPAVTVDQTSHALRIQADHVLHAYEAVVTRLQQTIAARVERDRLAPPLALRLAADIDLLPDLARQLTRRFPDEPYRQRLGFIAERLRRTRATLTDGPGPRSGAYERAEDFAAELDELAETLLQDGLARVARGEVQDLRWQLDTFGFHLAGLEIRQHAAVHESALSAIGAGSPEDRELVRGVTLGEVVASFRAVPVLQAAFGPASLRRYVVSFTAGADDVLAVLRLAEHAVAGSSALLDVVPLFESAAALGSAGRILDDLIADPVYRLHLAGRGDRQEVMLGYSDSNKELGYLAGNWMLYRAQSALVEVARRAGIELTLFHGRGGGIGRGGGRIDRAVLGQAPGSIDGRLKVTEQGEVITAHYADPALARRHVERMTSAVLVASLRDLGAEVPAVAPAGGPGDPTTDADRVALFDELAERSREAYRALVYGDPGFAGFFRRITPIDELAGLRFGSRPAARPGAATTHESSDRAGRDPASESPSIDSLRAIPWVFSWSQARVGLPGWYGLGAAVEGLARDRGLQVYDRLAELYTSWPFLTATIDNSEFSLARADMTVAARYATLATGPGDTERWAAIKSEYDRTTAAVRRITGRSALLAGLPAIQRAIEVRNPYVDALSELQVQGLAALRDPGIDAEREWALRDLVQLTVSGIAAGLQTTG